MNEPVQLITAQRSLGFWKMLVVVALLHSLLWVFPDPFLLKLVLMI